MVRGNFVVIDTETGGLDNSKHSLLSVAFVYIKDDVQIGSQEFFVKSDNYVVEPRAMEINGLDLKEVFEKGLLPSQIAEEVEAMAKKLFPDEKPVIVGHNIGFDVGFIRAQIMNKAEMDKIFSYRMIDTASVIKFVIDCGYAIKVGSLSGALEYLGIGSEESEGRHTAIYDATKTWQVYSGLCKIVAK